jgi:hypothetical protein
MPENYSLKFVGTVDTPGWDLRGLGATSRDALLSPFALRAQLEKKFKAFYMAPYIPNWKRRRKRLRFLKQEELFHELFHNLGYKHGEGIDFPYLCDSCCFPDKGLSANDALKARTCEMCAGKTLAPSRRDYISALTDAIDSSEGRGMTGFGYLTFHLASKFPKDPWFLYWSAYSAARMKDTKCLGGWASIVLCAHKASLRA